MAKIFEQQNFLQLRVNRLLGALIVTRNCAVYGRLPGRQNAAPGVYSDTVVVTVEY
ncbi:spore coat protein U domain-containing protein [Solimonas flava]|uniref:spore coat protein U domain-containing protein n=1 Tax=Solimonas flava TaxID=415849 RepID=UPI0003FA4DA2|nr:spore coat protein U domain-containing protein [Solimonas flava]